MITSIKVLLIEVSRIVNSKWDPNTLEPLNKVRWKGFTSQADTWEPLTSLLPTAAHALKDYLTELSSLNTQSVPRAKKSCCHKKKK